MQHSSTECLDSGLNCCLFIYFTYIQCGTHHTSLSTSLKVSVALYSIIHNYAEITIKAGIDHTRCDRCVSNTRIVCQVRGMNRCWIYGTLTCFLLTFFSFLVCLFHQSTSTIHLTNGLPCLSVLDSFLPLGNIKNKR